MKRSARFILLIALSGAGCTASRSSDTAPITTDANTRDFVDVKMSLWICSTEWERVWHEGQFNLVDCPGDTYSTIGASL